MKFGVVLCCVVYDKDSILWYSIDLICDKCSSNANEQYFNEPLYDFCNLFIRKAEFLCFKKL